MTLELRTHFFVLFLFPPNNNKVQPLHIKSAAGSRHLRGEEEREKREREEEEKKEEKEIRVVKYA